MTGTSKLAWNGWKVVDDGVMVDIKLSILATSKLAILDAFVRSVIVFGA